MLNKKKYFMKHQSGLTIIELVITVGVISILAVVAWPQFDRYQIKVSRADGIAGLQIAVNEIEQCGAQNFNFAGCGGAITTDSPREKYTIAIDADNTTASTYRLTATKDTGSADTECGVLSIDHLGVKGETGSKDVTYCWQR